VKILLQAFITRKMDVLRNKYNDATDANFVCYMSKEFADWIVEIRVGNDEWLKTNAIISIELGYQRFVPVWKVLGQSRYDERHW